MFFKILKITGVLVIVLVFALSGLRIVPQNYFAFDRENLVIVELRDAAAPRAYQRIRDNFKAEGAFIYAGISEITALIPGPRHENDNQSNRVEWISIDPNLLDVLKIELVEGRQMMLISDSRKFMKGIECVLTASAVSHLGFDNMSPLGAQMQDCTVVGVVSDLVWIAPTEFVPSSYDEYSPQPLAFIASENELRYLMVMLGAPEAIGTVKKSWAEIYPEIPFMMQSASEIFLNEPQLRYDFSRSFLGITVYYLYYLLTMILD